MTTLTSKTAKHTPGPWVVSENKRERTIQIDTADGKGTVVQPNAISWKPDAKLIAAAPEMLALLRRFAQWVRADSHECQNAVADAFALLARIEGDKP